MSKKILIAGGGGFIGGHLAKEMVSRGHDVRVVDIKPLDQWYQQIDNAENIVANLEEKEACLLQRRDVMRSLTSHVTWEAWGLSKIIVLFVC